MECERHAEEKRTQEGVVTYPLQSEVSPTFRRFQGLVSCLVFSSKFTSSWGGKRKEVVNAHSWHPRHTRPIAIPQKSPKHPNGARMGHPDITKCPAAPGRTVHATRHPVLQCFMAQEAPSEGWARFSREGTALLAGVLLPRHHGSPGAAQHPHSQGGPLLCAKLFPSQSSPFPC